MSRLGAVVVLSVGFIVAGCAGQAAPPRAPSNQLAPGTIAWPASLDHTSTPDSHREAAVQLLRESGTEAGMKAMTEIMLRQQLATNPIIQPYEAVLRKFLDKYMSFTAVEGDLARLFMETFSELQLRQLAAFYQTPTGKLAVRELPRLMEVAASLGKAKVEEHADELRQMIMDHTPAP